MKNMNVLNIPLAYSRVMNAMRKELSEKGEFTFPSLEEFIKSAPAKKIIRKQVTTESELATLPDTVEIQGNWYKKVDVHVKIISYFIPKDRICPADRMEGDVKSFIGKTFTIIYKSTYFGIYELI